MSHTGLNLGPWAEWREGGRWPGLTAKAKAHGGAEWGWQGNTGSQPRAGHCRARRAFSFRNLENQSLRSRSPGYQRGAGGSVKTPVSQMEAKLELRGPVQGSYSWASPAALPHSCHLLGPGIQTCETPRGLWVRSTRFNIKIFLLKKKYTEKKS